MIKRDREQIAGLIMLCREFLGLEITEEEAVAVLAMAVGSFRELPDIVRKLRVLH